MNNWLKPSRSLKLAIVPIPEYSYTTLGSSPARYDFSLHRFYTISPVDKKKVPLKVGTTTDTGLFYWIDVTGDNAASQTSLIAPYESENVVIELTIYKVPWGDEDTDTYPELYKILDSLHMEKAPLQ